MLFALCSLPYAEAFSFNVRCSMFNVKTPSFPNLEPRTLNFEHLHALCSLLFAAVNHSPRQTHHEEEQHGIRRDLEIEVRQGVGEQRDGGCEPPGADEYRKGIAASEPGADSEDQKQKKEREPGNEAGQTDLRKELQVVVVGMVHDDRAQLIGLIRRVGKHVGPETGPGERKIADQLHGALPEQRAVRIARLDCAPTFLYRSQALPHPPETRQAEDEERRDNQRAASSPSPLDDGGDIQAADENHPNDQAELPHAGHGENEPEDHNNETHKQKVEGKGAVVAGPGADTGCKKAERNRNAKAHQPREVVAVYIRACH